MSCKEPFRCHIVIPTYCRPQLLARTLESIAQADRPHSLQQVVVVENAVRGGAEAVCEQFAERLPVRYFFNQPSGRSRALQYAMERIEPGLAIMFDDDIRVAPRCLTAYESAACAQGPGTYFGGAAGIDYEQTPDTWMYEYLASSQKGYNTLAETPRQKGALRFLGFNLACFTEDFFAVGGMNPHLGSGALEPGRGRNPVGSEWDLQQRFQAVGVKPEFLPEARVWHYVPASDCSMAWLLNRRFRVGVEKSLKRHNCVQRLITLILSTPWRAVQYLVSFLIPGRRKRYLLRSKAFTWAGELQGLRDRRRLD